MKIISQFKIKDINRINEMTKQGDVVVANNVKYIRTLTGYVSELGTEYTLFRFWDDSITVIKKDVGDFLEDLLIEGEKRCKYY